MTAMKAITAPRIFDADNTRQGHAVLYRGDTVVDVVPLSDVPDDVQIARFESGMIVPGFVDLQVNGGGGVLLNDAPSVETIRIICRAHAQFGTTALLPTLITDSREATIQAIDAAADAVAAMVPGCIGLHLEGPHLSQARRGAHDATLVRPADHQDIDRLIAASDRISHLLVTVAPEAVSNAQIEILSKAGICVSLGHSDADCSTAIEAMRAGACLVTHLFNAMSPLGHRAPGMVGAALSYGGVSAGLIADGIHIDPVTLGVAIRAKTGPGKLFLVTDAMSTIGSTRKSFALNGRTVYSSNGRLTLEDGTLAGADIDMMASVRLLVNKVGVDVEEALRMASLYPAKAIRAASRHGRIGEGSASDLVHLSDDLEISRVWIGGKSVFPVKQQTSE